MMVQESTGWERGGGGEGRGRAGTTLNRVAALGPDRFCSARLDMLPQNVAAKSSIFCRAWHKQLDILLHFAPEKRGFYPLPV